MSQDETAVAIIQDPTAAEKALAVMTQGDLSKLTTEERAGFLANMAKSLGLNPLTKPVDLIKNDRGQLIIYFNKGATDQLRALHRVNLQVIDRYSPGPNLYAVVCRATMPNGRQDEATGVVVLNQNMALAEQANGYMKCETKAKRRVTQSILGLAMLDESELDTMPLFQQQVQNAPRMLSAPPGAQGGGQVEVKVIQEAKVVPGGSEELVEGMPLQEARSAPAVLAKPTSLPAAQVIKKRLPVAPPVVLK